MALLKLAEFYMKNTRDSAEPEFFGLIGLEE